MFNLKFLIILISYLASSYVNCDNYKRENLLTEAQLILYNRIRLSKYINNPYKYLNSSQVCIGTNHGFSSSTNEYLKLKAHYTGCVYVDGNVEINNFNPYSNGISNKTDENIEQDYDFSFLDDIKEITGYLLIHNTRLKSLRFKSLQIIRGKNLILNQISLMIDGNNRLKTLDLTNLKEIQRGNVFIQNNPNLCHMNEVNWSDIIITKNITNSLKITKNALTCESCAATCCSNSSSENCGCWFPYGCQKLTKVICHDRCSNLRCYGTGPFDCCNSQCSGGCTGPKKNECIGCSKLIVKETGDCVETCPRIQIPDPVTGDLIHNPDGMYQYGTVCLKTCPNNLFIYQEFCLKKCPVDTYEEEELFYDDVTGKKGVKRFCRMCTPQKCQKSCSIDGELNILNIRNLKDCEVLNSNLIITRPDQLANKAGIMPELEETDLKALNSLRIINGFVRIQWNKLYDLSFLSNLEIIRANIDLIMNKYSVIIMSDSLKTLSLKKLKSVENGIILLHTDQLCLHDTINWTLINNRKDSFFIKKNNSEYTKLICAKEGYICDPSCSGCWSKGSKSCQLCKTFKLDDFCVDQCENNFLNGRFIYLNDTDSRECGYCNTECNDGCYGPSEYECKKCLNFNLNINGTNKCVEKCPISHYSDTSDPDNKTCLPCYKDCYGCTGPKDYITSDGCTKCSSALVNNDPSYSIIKCIEKETYNCVNNEFEVIVPQSLKTHPLKGKNVCRKCNDECDECFENGIKLNSQCKKCKNFYSNSTGECVKNCSNEYLEGGKMTCLACNSECKLGCTGSGQFECNQCKTYKIKLNDLEHLLLKKINYGLLTTGDATIKDLTPYFLNLVMYEFSLNTTTNSEEFDDSLSFNHLSKLYIDYYMKKNTSKLNLSSIVFCVPECPALLPYKTIDNLCTDDNAKSASISILKIEIKIFFAFVAAILIIFFMIFIFMMAYWQNKRKLEKIYKKNEDKFFCPSYDENGGFDDSNKVDMSDLRLVNLNELKREKMLGRGAFGTVYKGYYMPFGQRNYQVRVAIKVLNKCKLSDEKAIAKLSDELINEAKVMASVDHDYCLRLTALCLAEPMMLVTQLMNYGSVVSFFQKYRDRVTEIMLLTWSKQIAEGMTYLESRGIVHRDLAARNILVKKFDHIKITDFGLARVIESNEAGVHVHEFSLVPFKWLAIESIKDRLFNHKSDVWSYGICIWEIFTFCSKPYAEYPENEPQTIYRSIVKGTRLAKPQMASLDLYMIMLRCWLENPVARPDFKTLANEFSKMCLDPKRYASIKDVDFNNQFKTIDDNTQDLLKEFKQNDFDDNDERLSNNESFSEALSIDKNNEKGDDMDSDELGSLNGVDELLANNNKSLASKSILNSLFHSFNSNSNSNEKRNNNVITFKRSNSSNKKNSISNNNQMTINNKKVIDNEKGENKDDNKLHKNRNFIKKIILGGLKLPTRLESQLSTGTASTYLSYSCSSDSTSSPKQANKKKSNFNFYEERQELLGVEKNLNHYDFSLSTSLSNSNSNNSSRSTDTSIDQIKPICTISRLNSRNSESTTKTNSDYLEPVMTNVIQNFEYFTEQSHKSLIPQQPPPLPPPPIIITTPEEKPKPSNRTYYNDGMNVILNKKRSTLF